jgi:type IV pilus assembly protein PilV
MKNMPADARGPRSRHSIGQDNNGYLMLEILIAVAIFSLGFLAVGTLIISTTRNNTTGNIITQATLLAAERLERLKDTPDITTLATGTYTDPNNPIGDQGNPGGIYTRSWTISDPLPNNTARPIQVRVSWNRLGQNRAVVLTTITRGNGT